MKQRGRPKQTKCIRGHLRSESCDKHGNCKTCRNMRERAERKESSVSGIVFQRCPVCTGTGLVSVPPGIAGDQPTFATSESGPWECPKCKGGLVIAVPYVREDGRIVAPWTDAQVEALNAYQRGPMHPFTCGGVDHPLPNGEAFESFEAGRTLIATRTGWTCPRCDYTQNWAHEFMAVR